MTEPQPPAGNPDHRPYDAPPPSPPQPYGAPPPGPPEQQYGVPPQHAAPLPQYGRPQPSGAQPDPGGTSPQYGTQPRHSAQPPRHATQPPQYDAQPQYNGQPQYGQQPPPHRVQPPQHGSQPQYGAQPQYGQQRPQQYGNRQYGAQQYSAPQYGGQEYGAPQYGGQLLGSPQYGLPGPQYPGGHQATGRASKAVWVPIGAVALVLLLLVGAVVFVTTRGGGDDTADAQVPTATYTDGVTTPSAQPSTTARPTTQPTQSAQPPSQTTPPPVGERRRTLKDIDAGIHVYDDIYVAPAPGWRKTESTKYSVMLETSAMPGAVLVAVAPAGWPARLGVAQAVDQMIAADRMKGVKKGAVRTMPPANSNVGAQAEQSYSGRITTENGVVVSLVARCTTLTGVETVHNVTVTVCVAAGRDAKTAVFKATDRMLASVARSI